jgi:hypothetical protein
MTTCELHPAVRCEQWEEVWRRVGPPEHGASPRPKPGTITDDEVRNYPDPLQRLNSEMAAQQST